ncbi:MAG TPA: hypothetical protein VI757_05765 [Bacteroidia bacterium]|nr:hypothetical protein [Bacteroidia bacterium]
MEKEWTQKDADEAYTGGRVLHVHGRSGKVYDFFSYPFQSIHLAKQEGVFILTHRDENKKFHFVYAGYGTDMYADTLREEVQQIIKEKNPTHYHCISTYSKLNLKEVYEDVKR